MSGVREKLIAAAEARGLPEWEVDELIRYVASDGEIYVEMPAEPAVFLDPKAGYIDEKTQMWPAVREAVIECCRRDRPYIESVWTGGIGTGKTHASVYTLVIQLHWLLCLKNPHEVFGLDPSSEIEIIFQSKTKSLAHELGYARFKRVVESSPWFRGPYDFDRSKTSQMEFAHNIVVKPVSGDEGAALGQTVIGGMIDELNFMQQVEKSQRRQDGSEYNQATSLYNAIATRRKSRFLTATGAVPGMLCLVSSANYRGQFTDAKIEEAEKNPGTIFVYDKRVWEVKPESFPKETFPVFLGDETRAPRLMVNDDDVAEADRHLVMQVPITLRIDFENDLLRAIRDVCGWATNAVHPYVMEPEKVRACFGKGLSVFSRDWCDFREAGLEVIYGNFIHPEEPRFVHIDLAATYDSCGFAIGWCRRFVKIDRGEDQFEILPEIVIDGVLEVRPPRGGEIIFEKVRQIIYRLTECGMNVKWVTYDTWQSRDSVQQLWHRGYSVSERSLDRDTRFYDIAKQAFYDGRVRVPEHLKAQSEFLGLERDAKHQKVDHKPNGSKDCSDALAGVIAGLSLQRATWHRHGQDPRHFASQEGHRDRDMRDWQPKEEMKDGWKKTTHPDEKWH